MQIVNSKLVVLPGFFSGAKLGENFAIARGREGGMTPPIWLHICGCQYTFRYNLHVYVAQEL